MTPAPANRRRPLTNRREASQNKAAHDGILVTDRSLQPIAADEGAIAILFGPATGGMPPDPAKMRFELPQDVLSQLRRTLQPSAPPVKVQLRIGSETYKVRAFLARSQTGTGQELVVLHFEKSVALDDAVSRVCREFHITEREQEVLRGVASGLTSKELAELLRVKPSTVKAFLRLIMIKLDVASRAGIVARILEYTETDRPET